MKVAFLDRDGTINKDYPDQKWKNIKEPELIDGSIEGIKKLIRLGYSIIIITNQYIINDGIITLNDYKIFSNKLLSIFKENDIEILDIYYCPHNDEDNCNCKKPKPGMILKALNNYDIDLNSSIYCGDSRADYLLATYFNIDFFGINYKGNDNIKRFDNLLQVSNYLENKF